MSEPGLRRGQLALAGASSPLIEAGPLQAREAVVFVHGNPGSSTDWTELVQAAGELGRAVAFDMPGFGGASMPADFVCDVPGYAAFLDGALQELGIERVHLVLHDFGGPFGLAWGVEHPERWASVALINMGVLPGYEWHTLAKRWRTRGVGELMHAYIPRFAWRRSMLHDNPRLPLAFIDKMYDDYDRTTRRTVLRLYRATPDPGETSKELGPALAVLHLPALVIWGAKDPYLGVEFAQPQREFFDVQELVVLPEAGHWPFQEEPERVRDALVPFLRGRLTATPAA